MRWWLRNAQRVAAMQDNQGLSRSDFISYGVSLGFAAAVLPISAWAITTSAEGIIEGSVQIPTQGADGKSALMPGYRAMPQSPGPHPVILVVHEIFGVHEHIQDICRRLAKQGYCAVAP